MYAVDTQWDIDLILKGQVLIVVQHHNNKVFQD